jgi:hypothetical protein
MTPEESCPFQRGQIVVYRPSVRGRGHVVHTDLAGLVPGRSYRVAQIVEERFVVIEGFENSPGGGLFWSEFEAK